MISDPRTPGSESPALHDPLQDWRERVLRVSLLGAALVALPFVASAVAGAARTGDVRRTVALAGGYLALLAAALVRRIPQRARAAVLVLGGLALGLVWLFTASMEPAAGLLLIGACVFASMVLGGSAGWGVLVVSLFGWLAAASPALRSLLPAAGAPPEPSAWILGAVALLVLGAALVFSSGQVQRHLTEAWRAQLLGMRRADEERAGLERSVAETARGMMRQAVQLQTAAEIAKLASQKLDPTTLLARAVELIREKFGFYHASAFLLDETGTWAELAASTGEVGRALMARHHRLPIGSVSLVGWASANRLTRLALDVRQDPYYFPNPLLPDTRAELAVPLLLGDRLLGVLDVQSVEAAAFTQDDVRAIEAIAGELAIALESSQELQRVRVQLDQAEGVVRGRLRASWSRLTRGGAVEGVRIAPTGEATTGAPALPAMALAGSAAQTVLTEDGREIAAPVIVRGEVVAVVGARKAAEGERWTDDELSLLEAVAGQCALALESARQTAEEQRRLAELEVLNRISQAVSQMLRLDSLFRVVHAQVNQILGNVDLAFAFFDPTKRNLSLPYVSRDGEARPLHDRPIGDDLLSYVLRSQQPLLLSSDLPRLAAELGVHLEEASPQSWLGVPMLIGEDVIGVISVEDRQTENRFTDDDAALLSTIASQVAAAFQNSRLLEQVQRAARRDHVIREITGKVRRSPDFKTILETTARELGRALNAAHTRVRLGTAEPPRPGGRAEAGPDGGPRDGDEPRSS